MPDLQKIGQERAEILPRLAEGLQVARIVTHSRAFLSDRLQTSR